MAENIKFLEYAANKVSREKKFMGYFLKSFQEVENLTVDKIIALLNCTIEDYYKLALCKAPNMNDDDFVERLNMISKYTNTSAIELNRIMKAIKVLDSFASLNYKGSSLLAARDNYSSELDTEEDNDKNEQKNS